MRPSLPAPRPVKNDEPAPVAQRFNQILICASLDFQIPALGCALYPSRRTLATYPGEFRTVWRGMERPGARKSLDKGFWCVVNEALGRLPICF